MFPLKTSGGRKLKFLVVFVGFSRFDINMPENECQSKGFFKLSSQFVPREFPDRFSSRTFTNKNSTSAVLQFARYNSTTQFTKGVKETRDVKLIGSIYQEPLTLKDGAKLISVKTVQPDGFYKVHRAIISSPKILELIGNNLSVGQRVYVSGELRANNFMNQENQNRQSFQIRVNELYASKLSSIEESKNSVDHNSVSLLVHVATDVTHHENHSRFAVATHFTARNSDEGEDRKTSFLQVYVHNTNLIDSIKNNLHKSDRVFISGSLSNKPETDQNGQKKFSGHIEATNILRVDRFSEAKNEKIIEESV